ncbi:MAG: hypothetical protein ACOVQB_08810 [Polynucleobacter sp.]
MKKIAIIGNMNNNGFSLMRFFRILGADAHLFEFCDDGCNTNSHFKPEFDTWQMHLWQDFIHKLNVPNSPIALLGENINLFIGKLKGRKTNPTSVKRMLKEYDLFIGSGITPAIFYKNKKKLDIFFPYSTGVEFLEGGSIYGIDSSIEKKILTLLARIYQEKGIQESKYILNSEMGKTQSVLDSINVKSINLPIPMVFNFDCDVSDIGFCDNHIEITNRIKNSDFRILSHSSHRWHNQDLDPLRPSKNNNWLIFALKELIIQRPKIKPLLIFIKNGPDVEHSEKLINDLGLQDFVVWLPVMPRRNLTTILSKINIVAAEFITTPRTIWGGTGWEALAAGKPLINGFFFQKGEFFELFGHNPPPILAVRETKDIVRHLVVMYDNPMLCQSLGVESKVWFNNNNGINLAERWLKLLKI